MELSARTALRTQALVVLLVLVCGATGIAAGIQPKLGLAAAIGLAFAIAVLGNVTLGLCLFTVLSFVDVLNLGGAAVSFMKVAGLLLFLSWYAAKTTQREFQSRSLLGSQPVLCVAAIAWISWSAVSVAWAESGPTALASTYRFLLNALLIPIVFYAIRQRQHFVWIVAAFAFGATLSAAFGLLQSSGARLAGGIGDPDGEAALLAAALMLSVGLTAVLPRGSLPRIGAILAAVVALVGLVDTGSRGGLVALGSALVLAVLFGGRWRSRAVLFLLAGLVATGFYLTVLAPSSASQHITSSSSTGRTDLWKVGVRMWEANPAVGVGSGNYASAAIHYVQQPGALTRADLIVGVPHVAHNTYLEILDELGIPGLIAFLTLVVASITAALQAAGRYARSGDTSFELLSRCLALAIVALLSADFFITNEYERLLWLLLSLPAPLLVLATRESAR